MKNYDIARCVLSVYNYRKDEDTNEKLARAILRKWGLL